MTTDTSRPARSISRLLKPRSVAIIGASPTPGALGASVLANLELEGFKGRIHLVNPKRDEINGRPCVRSIDDLPEDVDVAVLAIPGAAVLDTVRALARRKVGSAIIFSAGFAEGGEEGTAAQQEIGRIADDAGMVILGPNCLGVRNFLEGVPLTFIGMPTLEDSKGPKVALVSQSGAMANVISTTLMDFGLGLSYFVSTGNEAASGIEDYVEHLIDDPDTQVIGLIAEQIRQPRRFLALAAKARAAGKPIVLLHPGQSSAARESAATHTGAMAGDWSLMQSKVTRAGVILVHSLEEMGDVLQLVTRTPYRPRGGCVVLTESGCLKALVLDVCDSIGLAVPAPSDITTARLRAAMPDFIPVSNPMDLTAQALVDPSLYERTLSALLADDQYGSVLLAIIQTDDATAIRKFPYISDAIETLKPTKPVIFAGVDDGAPISRPYIDRLHALGVPYFPTPDRALRAIRRLGEQMDRDLGVTADTPLPVQGLPGPGVVPEYRAKQLLAPAGVAFPQGRFVTTLEQAQAAAAELGWPVALKAQSADLSHKSDAGGVILGLSDAASLAEGWARLDANIARHAPGLTLDGVLIEKMGARGLELIIGAKTDPEWGPVILVGLGGVQAEVFKDVRLLAPDLTVAAIESELLQLKSAALLTGFRSSPALDVRAAAEMIANLGRVLRAEPSIREIDLNPVVVYPQGQGVVALDALMLIG